MKKKILVPIMIVVLLIAMATTAYATSYTCTLDGSNTGSVKTASLTATSVYFAAYNQSFSTASMTARPQINIGGEWSSIGGVNLQPGGYYSSQNSPLIYPTPQTWRTKIYSTSGNGGAYGVGSINN